MWTRHRLALERDGDLHLAFMQLGCAVICHRMLRWQTGWRLDVKVRR